MLLIAVSQASCYHCDVILIMTSRAYGIVTLAAPSSHYDVVLIVTSFATELATLTVTDVQYIRVTDVRTDIRTYIRTDTLPHHVR